MMDRKIDQHSHIATPFDKVLIANRAEIALRIIRTANSMGLATVAVYSAADAGAEHVRMADESVYIGGAEPAESYLNIERIIDAAKRTGAQAIHPGYGFLAENEKFAQACVDNGLVFVGPTAQVIASMGDKAKAKQLMREAGVPCIPGYDGQNQDPDFLLAQAASIGYPVMIKAAAGGGGHGMRLVQSESQFKAALESACSESMAAFGNATVILERAILQPRHIEIQILADRHGNVIHLGERDCSTQRRHQKMIEEAPAHGLSAQMRNALGSAAVEATKFIGYEGAGTLEFLVDTDEKFYFMEMNTRLQVEHPVTEAITGIDLVAKQFLIAAGKELGYAQEDVSFNGHAIEVRLCAEDPAKNFMPQSGQISFWHAPGTARVETAISTGSQISPFYDSMFAKVIVHAAERDSAIQKICKVLDDTVVFGIPTNQQILLACLHNPEWRTGGFSVNFVAQRYAELLTGLHIDSLEAVAIVAALACYRPVIDARRIARRLPAALLLHDKNSDQTEDVEVTWSDDCELQVLSRGQTRTITVCEQRGEHYRLMLDGYSTSVWYQKQGLGFHLRYNGHYYTFTDISLQSDKSHSNAIDNGSIYAASSCKVVDVLVQAGATVRAGDTLLITSAMKMEHEHTAPFDGVVTDIRVAAGEQATEDQLLVVLSKEAVGEPVNV